MKIFKRLQVSIDFFDCFFYFANAYFQNCPLDFRLNFDKFLKPFEFEERLNFWFLQCKKSPPPIAPGPPPIRGILYKLLLRLAVSPMGKLNYNLC